MRLPYLALLLAPASCFFYGNNNTGDDGNLVLAAPTGELAVGDPFPVTVQHTGKTLAWGCIPLPGGRCGGETKVDKAGVDELIAARCEGPCTATLDERGVTVVGTGSGIGKLFVKAHLSDGSVREDSTSCSFLDVGRLSLRECYSTCGVDHAVLPGAVMRYRLVAENIAADGRARRLVTWSTPEVSGDAVSQTSWSATQARLELTAVAGGKAAIHWKVGAVEQTWNVRVAGLDELVRGEVFDSEVDGKQGWTITPATGPFFTKSSKQLLLGWTLSDGSIALGGAGAIEASTDVDLRVGTQDAATATSTGQTSFAFFVRSPGDVRFRASIGADKRLDWTASFVTP